MPCGGDTEIFIEPITSAPALFVFGGGHIAVPLVKMAAIVGFKVTVIDERPDFASAARFPDAAEVLASDYMSAYSRLGIDKNSYIVIVTHGHKGDEAALEGALKTPAKYIGMIGSKTKDAAVFAHLLAKGFTQDDLNRTHAPIGISIKAQTPEEIAVSILAEMIAAKRSADEAISSSAGCQDAKG